MARKIERDPNALTVADLPRMVTQYRSEDAVAKAAAERATKMKERMRTVLVAEGYADDKGHLWIDLEDVPGVKQGLKHEKRTSEELDREKMIEWLKKQPSLDADGDPEGDETLWDLCKATVEVLDEDAFWALVYDERIPPRIIKKFTEEKTSWAFKIV